MGRVKNAGKSSKSTDNHFGINVGIARIFVCLTDPGFNPLSG